MQRGSRITREHRPSPEWVITIEARHGIRRFGTWRQPQEMVDGEHNGILSDTAGTLPVG